MPIPVLTQVKFEGYKITFRKTVEINPASCTLMKENVTSTGDFTDFTGDSDRTTVSYNFKCLYKREFQPAERTKYGLHGNESGIIWLAPDHLATQFGTWKVDVRKWYVKLAESIFIVDRVVYEEPLFGSCLAIRLYLVDIDLE